MGKRRPRPSPPAPRWSSRLYVRLAPRDAARLKFLLEGHDNLAYQTTLDRHTALLQLTFSPDQEREVRAFLESVRGAVEFELVEA